MMHQCNYCSESFFSTYSLASHLRIHNKEAGKSGPGSGGTAFPGFVPPSTVPSHSHGPGHAMDYSWHQSSWQWGSQSGPSPNNPNTPSSISSFNKVNSTASNQISINSNNQRYNQNHMNNTNTTNDDSNDTSDSENDGNSPNSNVLPKRGKVYECPSCKKVFRSYPGLRYHRNSKHDQNGPFKCGFCSKRFCQRSHLSRHETLHTGEKKFSCEYCEKTFRIKGNLQIHIRIHTGEKPYHCGTCGKRFTQQQSAKSHERLHKKYK